MSILWAKMMGCLPLALCHQAAVSSVQKDMDQVCSSLQESAFFPLEAPIVEGWVNRWDVLALTSLTDHSARSVLTKLRHPRNV